MSDDWTLNPADLYPPTVPVDAPEGMPEPPRCPECHLIPDTARATCLTCLSGRDVDLDDGAVPLVPGDPEMPDDPIAQDEYFRDADLDNKGRRESLLLGD